MCVASLISASQQLDFLMGASPLRKEIESLRAKCIYTLTHLVRRMIQDMPENPSAEHLPEELIGALSTLSASHLRVVDKTSWPTPRFSSPLAPTQCINVWGAAPPIKAHRFGFIRLINLKGGIEQLSPVIAGIAQL